jgi:hypothetical protein
MRPRLFGQTRAGNGGLGKVLELSCDRDAASQPRTRAKAPNDLSSDLTGAKKAAVARCVRLLLYRNSSLPLSLSRGRGAVMTFEAPTRWRDGAPAVTQEERLLDLIRQAEAHAYALAHSHDIGRQPDWAYAFVALAERLHETAADLSGLVRHGKPLAVEPAMDLVSRALCLRMLLRGTAWEGRKVSLGGAATSKIGTNDVFASLTPLEHSV